MKKLLSVFLLLLQLGMASAFTLSDSAKVSLITCAPGKELYAQFGHTAIRIYDPPQKLDLVYNYGSFDFNTKNFYVKFIKGETDYQLAVYPSFFFYPEYAARFTRVWEQDLDLLPQEKQQLFDALMVNFEPQNRGYRYNFLFDNCATRPRDMLVKYLNGTIAYKYAPAKQTFRELLADDLGKDTWVKFGIDLLLGAPADKVATADERMFLPIELMNYFETATVSRNGVSTPLVKKTVIDVEGVLNSTEVSWYAQPIFTTVVFLLLVSLLSFVLRKKNTLWMDAVLFSISGIVGGIVFFLSFFSVHPAVSPNFNLLWAHPFNLLFVLLLPFKKLRKGLSYYQLLNVVLLIVFLAGGIFLPQHFNTALYPFVAALFIRSILFVRSYR